MLLSLKNVGYNPYKLMFYQSAFRFVSYSFQVLVHFYFVCEKSVTIGLSAYYISGIVQGFAPVMSAVNLTVYIS